MNRLLILNPGATSTKVAVYEDEQKMFQVSIEHEPEDLLKFGKHVIAQKDYRRQMIEEVLRDNGWEMSQFDAVVARGGILPPLKMGAYAVNQDMIDVLTDRPVLEHASNLGAVIGAEMAEPVGIPTYIYDAVCADEMYDVLRITGLPELRRKGQGHNLNLRASAIRYAQSIDRKFSDLNLIVAHLGGGSSIALFRLGRLIDMVNDEDGPFTPERAGALPMLQLLQQFLDPDVDHEALFKKIRKQAGLTAYFGTTDLRKVRGMADAGDEQAKEIIEAMAINIAKCIGKEAPVVNGRVDQIILTGGIAHDDRLTRRIAEMVSYIAPVTVYAGEFEMDALAQGGLRVLNGKEEAHVFSE